MVVANNREDEGTRILLSLSLPVYTVPCVGPIPPIKLLPNVQSILFQNNSKSERIRGPSL